MTTVRSIVERFALPSALLGGPGSGAFDQRGLQRELARLRSSREAAFWICAGFILVTFALATIYLVIRRDDPKTIAQMSTATGIGIMALIAAMTKLWQSKVKADVLVALVGALPEDSARDVLVKVLGDL